MLTPAALTMLAPLFMGLSQAAGVIDTPPGCSRCPHLMFRWVLTFGLLLCMIMGCVSVGFTVASFYKKCSPLTDSSSQIATRSIDDVSANVTLVERDLLGPLSSAALSTVMTYPCSDKKCLKKYYDEKKECHPYDMECYKDSSSWDDYKDRCTNSVQKKGPYDPYNPYGPYDKCYDKCYYERQGCFKYRKCSKDNKEYDDKDCYKKRRDEPEPPKYRDRFCKPKCKPENKDCYECKKHREEPDKYECDPRKDKHEYCLPHYDDHDDHDHHHHDYHPFEPKSYITAHFYNDYGKDYIEKVWPDGDEHWFNEGEDHWKKHFDVKFIKYYSEKEDGAVRCLPTKSYFPWTPLKIEKFVKLPDEYGLKVHGLYLEKSEPVEVIRCDLP